jgi:hypothetical protein
MKNALHFELWLIPAVLSCFGASASLGCTFPPQEGLPGSQELSWAWPASARVQVIPDSQVNSFGAITIAMNNWNTYGLIPAGRNTPPCFAPQFTFSAGTGQKMTVAYGPIPQPPGSTLIVRARTDVVRATRVLSAATLINSNIPLTFPNVMTEVMAHEIGHTVGLNDCHYYPFPNYPSGCPTYSTVMEDAAPVPIWTGTQGQPGPIACDEGTIEAGVSDYNCPCDGHLPCGGGGGGGGLAQPSNGPNAASPTASGTRSYLFRVSGWRETALANNSAGHL